MSKKILAFSLLFLLSFSSVAMIINQSEPDIFSYVLNGDVKKVKLWINNCEDINIKNDEGMTPLNLAISSFDVSKKRVFLFVFITYPHLDIAELLLNSNANANIADINGTTPLMHAAKKGLVDTVVNILQKFPKAIDAEDNEGNTALDYARGLEKTTRSIETFKARSNLSIFFEH